ncbi:MAG: hypothetical protein CFE50_13580 [Pseudomonas sp. PGPPP4]|nr:MAG: hypothetical protein CFE50_13580 [Pseudomonas sp. PGPPP4]
MGPLLRNSGVLLIAAMGRSYRELLPLTPMLRWLIEPNASSDSPLSPWERAGVRVLPCHEVFRGKGCAVFHATWLTLFIAAMAVR